MERATIITGEENIQFARTLTLKHMLSLELKGMCRRGRSAYAIVKDEFGFKGDKQKVLDQLNAFIEFRSKQLELDLKE
jgi:hypothetical protein